MAEVKTIKFQIVTPERVLFEEDILQVSVSTTSGEITVLPGHIPLVSVLQPGVIEVKLPGGSLEIMSVSGGFVEVMRDKVVVLADTAERAEELDEKRIKEAYNRAAELKKEPDQQDEVDMVALKAQIDKESARFRALRRWRRLKGDSFDQKN